MSAHSRVTTSHTHLRVRFTETDIEKMIEEIGRTLPPPSAVLETVNVKKERSGSTSSTGHDSALKK